MTQQDWHQLSVEETLAGSAVAAIGMVIGLLYLVAGFWLMANLPKSWWVCLPAAVLSLFTFPVGTLIAIYYLWYYFKHEQVR
ncbi:MAG TPA: hypothetical protein VK149_04075 [Sideroxyarcus sp.]|nr:hypothetical protein [Sideroxyarcus sp.]